MTKSRILILLIFFQCSSKSNNVFLKTNYIQNQYSERIPIILLFGDSSKITIPNETFYIDSWVKSNLQLYRVDKNRDFFGQLFLEEEDIIEDLTFYNAKYYKSEFKAFFIPLIGSIENTDDKIIATGFLRKKIK
ncbi:hypothetical protein [Leptospira soteropolitanensis]|uniref:Lipoprotein n=2 Tax=Leptospira soteropolitanensis TaxID=2950025 RepID=A0AAW5VHP0_9LEPT|nr:hypothetical protein [Leptospira soteropolitanensis]MCW7502375.1 hypothetical protein [Leptospira soteropolitanensis]MCW7532344.1 hypothetical protein [Leptospira soteropolitanensis]